MKLKIIAGLGLIAAISACTPEIKCSQGQAVKAANAHQKVLADAVLTANRGYTTHKQRVSEAYTATCSYWNGYSTTYYSCTKHRTRIQETPVPLSDTELQRIRDSIPALQAKQRRLHERSRREYNSCLARS